MAGSQEENIFGKVIYEYSREQALKDGVLVDVTETAKKQVSDIPSQ